MDRTTRGRVVPRRHIAFAFGGFAVLEFCSVRQSNRWAYESDPELGGTSAINAVVNMLHRCSGTV